MRPFLIMGSGKVWFNIGWFADEPFALFKIAICETSYKVAMIHFVALLELQIAKFCVSLGFYP